MNLQSLSRCGTALALALALAASLPAQDTGAAEKKQHSLSDKTSEELKKLTPLQNEKKFDDMLKVVDGALAVAAPESYDRAFLLDIKAKIYLSLDKLGPAIPAWEEAMNLHAKHEYFDQKYASDILLYLAQLIFGEAIAIKDQAQQAKEINRAAGYLKRHLDLVKNPSADTLMLYAQLLFQQATIDQNNINQDQLKQAREVVERALMSAIEPKEGFYTIYLAILQQQNETLRSAEVLELMLKKFPAKKDYWPALMGTYIALAGAEKSPERQKEYYIRAINACERAQALGLMKDPKDNYNLFTIYTMAGQIGKATDILHAGLKSGGIESNLANWRYLGSYYQQDNKEQQALDALKEAAKLFPKEGMLDLQIGELYRQMEKTEEARKYYRSAIDKGHLEKPLQVLQLLAYSSMELEDWPAAQAAINEAARDPNFAKDAQLRSLKEHIETMVKDIEEQKKIKEEAANANKKKTP